MLAVKTGPDLIAVVMHAKKANVPLMLHGKHGVGKSETLVQTAAGMGIDVRVRDLSLMEPPDLLGLPSIGKDGRTRYAAPAFLPEGGEGLLVIEELNRAPAYMRAPCLQLLTARELGDYKLPNGWLPCAAVNDSADGYTVDELDPALHSRFIHVRVVPDVDVWLDWAKHNGIHPDVCSFIEQSPGAFDDPASNPRSWTMVSRVLSAPGDASFLPVLVAGIVGDTWAEAFLASHGMVLKPLSSEDILTRYVARRAGIAQAIAGRKLDIVQSSINALQRHLQREANYKAVLKEPEKLKNVLLFVGDIPSELRRTFRVWLQERGYNDLLKACGSN